MNKLMLIKGRAMACLVLTCLFLAQGCKKDLLKPNSKDLQNGISVTEARAYFDKNLRTVKPKKLASAGILNGETTIEDALASKQPIWKNAYQKMISTGASVKVPIDFGDAMAVINPKTNSVVPLSSLNYLFMYKDSMQVVHTEWIILDPDSVWFYGDRKRYTGNIIVKDWKGKTLRKLVYSSLNGINTSAGIKQKLLSSNGKILNTNGIDQVDNAVGFCTLWPTGKCSKQGVCAVTCDKCLAICAKWSCSFFDCSPECDLPSETGGGGGGGGTPGNPWAPGGGGVYPPDDCGGGGRQLPKPPANNNPDPNAMSVALPPCIPKPIFLNDDVPELIPTPEELEPLYLPSNFDINYPQEYFDTENSYDALALELIQAGVNNTDPIPEAYYKYGTRIDMTNAPVRNGRTALGIPRNPSYFWKELIKLRPEMFNESNRSLVLEGKSPVVNEQWIKYNPTHKSYLGEQLIHHHEGQGKWAYAIPKKVHLKWNRILHSIRIGKFPKLRGTMNSLAGGMQIFSLLVDFNTGNPDAWLNWYGATDEVGKVYKQPLTGDYFVITKQTKYRNIVGDVIRAKVTYDVYADYIWDEDEKKYMGVLKLGTFTENIDMNNRWATDPVWEPKG